MSKHKEAIRDLRELGVWQLAGMADCGDPDSNDSAGGVFLRWVRDDVCELLNDRHESGDEISVDELAGDGSLHEIADSAPDVYTYTMWHEFADLAAWKTDTDDFGPFTDMDTGARTALYVIAQTLAYALVAEYVDAVAE